MKTKLPVMLASVVLLPWTTAVMAATERQHGAHEHGAAQLSIAIDDHEVVFVLESPAYNVFGFEFAPSTAEQQAAIDAAVARLRDADALWTLSPAAACQLDTVTIDSAVLETDDADHDDDSHQHNDVDVSWRFHCDNSEALVQVEVGLFDAFERFDDLDVQYLTETRQGAAELSPHRTILNLE